MHIQQNSISLFALIQILLLLGLALLQTLLLLSGDNRLYQAPRMQPFLVFSTVTFCILALHGVQNLFRPAPAPGCACGCAQGREISLGAKTAVLVLFGLILGTGFLLPHQVLDSRVAEKKGIALQRQPASPVFSPQTAPGDFSGEHLALEDIPWDSAQALESAPGVEDEQDKLREELGIWYDRKLYTEMTDELLARKSLEITGETFLDAMLIISAYLDDFAGRAVEFSGFAYHDGTMAENELAVARIAITCCLADATVYGLLVRAPGLPLPANDVWVRVQGRIAKTKFMDDSIPMILADHLETIPAPDQPYVYPRLYSRYVLEPDAK
jgi:putative membrane protein